jgi:predicted acylesterase/phospholipase RssA
VKYDLVFEGGGAKGFVLVGACDELFRRGHTYDRLLGTSAGAITATLLACGYTPDEMLTALGEQENGRSVFGTFMAVPAPFTDEELSHGALKSLLDGIQFNFLPERVERRLDAELIRSLATHGRGRHLMAFIERGGWYGADPFLVWLRRKLDSGPWKEGQRQFSALTLTQLFERTSVELSLVASDTTDARMLVLNHRTAPDCPVVWAVRMSMSIPLVWNEVVWEPAWGQYLGRDVAGHFVVDGGVLSNFPIELFVSSEPRVAKLMGPKGANPVLGMLIDEHLPVPSAKGRFVTIDIKPGELRTVQRLQRLIDTATTAHDKMVIDEYTNLVVQLPAQGYGTTEFDMSEERRTALVDAGRTAMALYFDTPRGLRLPTKAGGGERVTTRGDTIALNILK